MITFRRLWKRAALTLLLGMVVAACTNQSDEGSTHLDLLQWQAPTHLNSWLSSGTKDLMAASLVLEPLAGWSPDGELVPKLAASIPDLDNGGVASDLRSITWELRQDILWSDGTAFTAHDVVFSWEYCTAEGAGCSQTSAFEGVSEITAVDDHTILITFDEPVAFPYTAFVGFQTPIIQRAQFEDCLGPAANTCTEENHYPVGTGPFVVNEFRVEDTALFEVNPHYRGLDDGKPYFQTVELKGGGTAAAAASSVLESSDADYSWNIQVAPEVLEAMVENGDGYVLTGFTARVEYLVFNQTDPTPGPNRSDHLDGTNPHPVFADSPDLIRALSMAIDRSEIVRVAYGPSGREICSIWASPPANSTNHDWCLEQDIDGANALLDQIGAIDTNGDGIRELDGVDLVFDFVTTTGQVRQDTQELLQSYWEQIGVGVNLQDVVADQFFADASESQSSIWRFYSDIMMYTDPPLSPDPQVYMVAWLSSQIPESSNNWAGGNIARYASPQYDAVYAELAATADLDRRSELVIELNDMLIDAGIVVPLVYRGSVSAFDNSITGVGDLNGWDSEYWNIEEWGRS